MLFLFILYGIISLKTFKELFMDGKERRKQILQLLEGSNEIINATVLSEKFGVTRQIIVSDIALLRANGNKILSEKRGYFLEKDSIYGIKEVVICKHDKDNVLDELYAVVDNGGKIVDVIVEHPIYGQISADLNISSRYDAEEFVKTVNEFNAIQLCELTNGIHYHTLVCPNETILLRIKDKLKALKILQD